MTAPKHDPPARDACAHGIGDDAECGHCVHDGVCRGGDDVSKIDVPDDDCAGCLAALTEAAARPGWVIVCAVCRHPYEAPVARVHYLSDRKPPVSP